MNTSSNHLLSLQRQQNKGLRVLKEYVPCPVLLPNKSSTQSMYIILIILPVKQVLMLHLVLFVAQYRKRALPVYSYESELFQVLDEVNSCRQSRGGGRSVNR